MYIGLLLNAERGDTCSKDNFPGFPQIKQTPSIGHTGFHYYTLRLAGVGTNKSLTSISNISAISRNVFKEG